MPRPTNSRPRARKTVRALASLAAPIAVVIGLAGCSSNEPSPNHHAAGQQPPSQQSADRQPGHPAATQVALDPPLDHLHGLHLDADGAVLAGTHTGIFRIEMSGGTVKIGASDDDFMGLAGAPATNNLFASGHPGPSSSAPNPLGLTASLDGGRTWESRSLLGEIDFHALATDGQVLVGFDGVTGIVSSTDGGRTWTPGAEIDARALAVTDAGVWATTAEGLQHSTDSGRTFTAAPDAPSLVLVSAAADGSLWGLDTSGAAWRSKTGESWEKRSAALGNGADQAETVLALDFDTAYAVNAETLFTLG